MSTIICYPHIYEYEGIVFEIPHISSPWPVKKDGSPCARAGKKFYDMLERFFALPKEEQEKHHLGGGCVRIGG